MIFETKFIWVGLMQIIGFFVQGCTGFGCTVIAAAVTNGLLGTTEGVPYGTLITLPFMYFLGIKAFKDVSWKDLAKIICLCMPGILVGNYLFHAVSPDVAKICIGAMVTFIALMNIYKHIIKPLVLKKEVEEEVDTPFRTALRYGCLVLGGIVHGAFNIGGPLITVYTIAAVKEKEKFRNTMNMVWVILNTWNAFSQFRNGDRHQFYRIDHTTSVKCIGSWSSNGSSWILPWNGILKEDQQRNIPSSCILRITLRRRKYAHHKFTISFII